MFVIYSYCKGEITIYLIHHITLTTYYRQFDLMNMFSVDD